MAGKRKTTVRPSGSADRPVSQAPKTAPEVSQTRIQLAIQNRFNPIRGLTPELLARYLENFKVGYLRDAALTWDAMEQRDPNLKNVAGKSKKSVSRLPWEILTTANAPEAEAAKQKEVLDAFYNALRTTDCLNQDERGGLRLLIRQMMDAKGKRFAVHEIIWKPGESFTAELRFVPLWFFENRTGKLRFLPGEGTINGTELEPNGWLVSVGEGLMEASSVAYIYKSLPLKDWLSFCEKFGLPGVIGKTDAAKDSAEWTAMEEAVQSLINDWAAVMNRSSEIALLETKNGGGTLPFEPLVEYMDRKIAALWRGADLSTISSGNAEGHGASVQGDETDIILEDDAMWIEETLNEQLSKFVLQYHFGPGVPALAYLKLGVPKKKNVAEIISAIDCCQRTGIALGVDATREKLGLPKPDDDDELLEAPEPAAPERGAGERSFANEAVVSPAYQFRQAYRAFAGGLNPVTERLARILDIEDPVIRQERARALLDSMPSLARDINADPEAAYVIADMLEEAARRGAKGEVPK